MQSNPNIDYDFFDEDDKGGTSNVRPKSSASPGRRASNTRNTDSEEPDRSVVRIEATVPQVARSSDNYSENFESDEEDGGNSTRRSKSEESTKKDGDDDSESDGESKQAQTRAGRPKTGVRNRRERLSNGDSDNKGSNDDDGSSSGTITDSDTNSDSDITDVSPLNSPSSPKSSRRRIEFGDTTTLGDARPKSGRPQSGKSSRSNYQQLLQPNRDTMNLKLLMQAISEMESDGPGRTKTAKRSSFSGRTTRQYVAPADRRNYSFRNNQIRDIDKENQRLMQQIMTYSTAVKKQKVKKAAPVTPEKNRPTTSAVNRMKEQRRIEEENRAMLRRLEQTRPTDTLQRNTLIQGFNTHTLAGVPMGSMHPLAPGKPSPYNHPVRDGRLRSHSTSSLTGRRSRPQSAKLASRPSSAKVPTRPQSAKAGGNVSTRARPPSAKLGRANSLDSRPAWQD